MKARLPHKYSAESQRQAEVRLWLGTKTNRSADQILTPTFSFTAEWTHKTATNFSHAETETQTVFAWSDSASSTSLYLWHQCLSVLWVTAAVYLNSDWLCARVLVGKLMSIILPSLGRSRSHDYRLHSPIYTYIIIALYHTSGSVGAVWG